MHPGTALDSALLPSSLGEDLQPHTCLVFRKHRAVGERASWLKCYSNVAIILLERQPRLNWCKEGTSVFYLVTK